MVCGLMDYYRLCRRANVGDLDRAKLVELRRFLTMDTSLHAMLGVEGGYVKRVLAMYHSPGVLKGVLDHLFSVWEDAG